MKIDQQISEAIANNKDFVVVSHIRPDGDAIGSALGLAQVLRQAGKQVTVVFEDDVAEKYATLARIQVSRQATTQPIRLPDRRGLQ